MGRSGKAGSAAFCKKSAASALEEGGRVETETRTGSSRGTWAFPPSTGTLGAIIPQRKRFAPARARCSGHTFTAEAMDAPRPPCRRGSAWCEPANRTAGALTSREPLERAKPRSQAIPAAAGSIPIARRSREGLAGAIWGWAPLNDCICTCARGECGAAMVALRRRGGSGIAGGSVEIHVPARAAEGLWLARIRVTPAACA